MQNWYDAYLEQVEKSGGILNYTKIKLSQKKKLIKILREYSGKGKIIETGCGTGIISSKLSSFGYDVTGIDVDDNILDFARNIEKKIYSKSITNFKKESIFDLKYDENEFDLCFSVGVLEHFTDEEIISSLRQQIRIAKKTIVVIPTKWFDKEDTLHGDDRFLELSYWRKLIKESNGKIIKESSYSFKGNGFSCFQKLKRLFRTKAYRIFVIEAEK